MLKAGSMKFILTLLMINGFFQTTKAQDTLLTVTYRGKLDSLNSAILQQKRHVQVFMPEDYKPGSTEKYDVLYVTDGGNWNISLVTQLQRFIQNEGHMPPAIIVSIMGIDRNIELTPTVLKTWNAPTGGAANFLRYIKEELIPYINKTYPSNGDNTLFGHSLGGMFVGYTMLREPGLFKSYVAIDPSFWWDNSLVPKMAAEKLQVLNNFPSTLFISGREGPPFHEMKIDTMETILKKMAPANLKWKVVTYANETHGSIRLKTIYDGLMYTYDGLTRAIEFLPMNGIVLKDKPYKIVYTDDTSRVHYTLDGTEPTEQSAQVNREITVTGPAKVTYRRLSNRSRYDKSVTGNFTTGTLPTPLAKPGKAKPGGFRYTYYEGDAGKRPDLKTAKAIKTGIFNKDFTAAVLPRNNNYCLVLDGLLEAKEEGYYTFFVKAGKGSKLWIGGKLIMQWDDNDKHEYFVYLLPLSKGFYPVKMESYDKKEDFNLQLYYNTPGMPASGDPIVLPFDLEYGVGKN